MCTMRISILHTAWICFRNLLHSEHIEVSYFAAGIASHLISDGAEAWTVTSIKRDDLIQELVSVG